MGDEPGTLHELFRCRAAATPDRMALAYGGQSLTYGEVNARANQVAHYLRARGVRPDTLVPLCLERSFDLVVAILGVLKAGGAYVPLDPAHPAERLRFSLEDCQASLLLTTSQAAGGLAGFGGEIILLDQPPAALARGPEADPPAAAGPGHLAYAIYTSGSTGRPKAALVEHRSVINCLLTLRQPGCDIDGRGPQRGYPDPAGTTPGRCAARPAYARPSSPAPLLQARAGLGALGPKPGLRFDEDVHLFQLNPTFDASVLQIFGPAACGGCLAILPAGEERDPAKVWAALHRHGVTHAVFVPSALQALLGAAAPQDTAALARMKALDIGGEALARPFVERLRELLPHARMRNLYGPTEATIAVTGYDLRRDFDGATAPMGRPLPNVVVHILDEHLQPVAEGDAGELCIGGVAVARGYLNRPELTAACFLADPFAAPGDPGGRLYKTGDLCRQLPDGEIEYVGRRDRQVKVRGYRIELGEIESRLAAHPAVADAVVTARPDAAGELRLAAYFVARADKSGVEIAALREHLRQSLPAYMVPTAWRQMSALPVTDTGKRDLRALPEIELAALPGPAVARSPLGQAIAKAWTHALGTADFGDDDDFFTLGGHSLAAARVAAALRDSLGKEVGVGDLYRAPTIAGLERLLSQAPDLGIDGRGPRRGCAARPACARSGLGAPGPQAAAALRKAHPAPAPAPQRRFPLSYQQLDCWLLEKGGAPNLNVLDRKRVAGRLDRSALAAACERAVAQHPALQYRISAWLPRQAGGSAGAVAIEERDLAGLAPEQREEAVLASLAELTRYAEWRPGMPLVRLRLLRLEPAVTEVQVCMPHIVSDEAALTIFFEDLSQYYQDPHAPPPAGIASYETFVREQRAELRPLLAPARAFWEAYLDGAAAIRFPETEVVDLAGTESVYVEMPADEVAALSALARQWHLSLPDLLHALALDAIAPHVQASAHGGKPAAYYTPRSLRTSAAYDRMMGPVSRLDCLKVDVAGDPGLAGLAQRVRDAKVATEPYQACPVAIKSASLYKARWSRRPGHDLLSRLAARELSALLRPAQLDYEVVLAEARMLSLLRAPVPDFTLVVNVLNSFLAPGDAVPRCFGYPLAEVRRLPTYQPPVARVLEIYFLREPHRRQQPFLMLNGDLSPAFRQGLGETMLEAMEQMLRSTAPAH